VTRFRASAPTLAFCLFWSGALGAVSTARAAPEPYRLTNYPISDRPTLTRGPGHVVPVRIASQNPWVHRSGQLSQVGDTVWVYRDSLETRSSPGNEGGFTHQDASFQPAAWHIDTIYGCQGHAFWCGRVDSSWVQDANRYGYDNGWTQILANFVDLSGAASPVKIGFRHQLGTEQGFDFGTLQVLDPTDSWIDLGTWSGQVHGVSVPCDTFSVQIPDSIIAKYNPIQFRFIFTSDVEGSSSDGLAPNTDGWAVDNVTVKAGTNDLRFFDDFEFGPGTWTVSTFPAVGDFWRIQANAPGEQICSTNTSKVWNVTNPATGALTPRIDDKLISPPIFANRSDQLFAAFDVYRSLPVNACFYYNVQFRTRNAGDPSWSLWTHPSSDVYAGDEKEWLRQTVALTGAGGKDSVEFMVDVKDYSALFCDGVSTTSGTAIYVDNLALGVVGLAPPSISASEADLFQDTFNTTPFFSNDNFNTPMGDSVSVRISATRGLKQASFFYSLNGASFLSLPLTPFGAALPSAYSADVPAASYARGTQLRYYFSVTDSLNDSATLPSDALGASHYFTATILPAIQSASGSCAGNTANVLYVNAYAGVDDGPSMDQSFTSLGLRFDSYDVNAPGSGLANAPGGSPPGDPLRHWPGVTASALGVYSAIVWDIGDRSSLTLGPQDQQLLQSWLKLPGGNRGLLIAGDNLAYDLVTNAQDIGTFLGATLGAGFLRDIWENVPQDSLSPVTAGAAGTRIASEPFQLDGQCPKLNRFDALTTSGTKSRAWINYPNPTRAAVERRDSVGVVADSSRSVLTGFSLSSLPSVTRRNLLLYRTLVNEFEVPTCYVATGVEEPAAAATPRARLYDAAPNPFNPFTSIRFSLERPMRVRLTVFDVSGARVRTLADRPMAAGQYQLTWDGTNDRGRPLASGAYFYRLDADGQVEAKKLILLR
jgi:hypothetical protein